jgi:hypothetical protein
VCLKAINPLGANRIVFLTDDQIIAVIEDATSHGLVGFGGDCVAAAIAFKRVLFGGQAKLICAFNAALLAGGVPIGHVAVKDSNGIVWDCDAAPKCLRPIENLNGEEELNPIELREGLDDIEHWGMLDVEDTEWKETADRLNIAWDDVAANEVDIREMDTDQALINIWTSSFTAKDKLSFNKTLAKFEKIIAKSYLSVIGHSSFLEVEVKPNVSR